MRAIGTMEVPAQIRELRRLRVEAAVWRWAATLIAALTVVWSILTLRGATLALIQPGAAQDTFTSSLTEGLKTDVVPEVQEMAGRTLTEMRPQLVDAFNKAAQRAPELAGKSEQELNTLQKNVASRSEKALDDSFAKQLHDREPKIKQMFPNATDDKINTLVQNLSDMGTQRLAAANEQLFSKHMAAMNDIVTDMTMIQDAEKVSPKSGSAPTYELATAVLGDLEKQVSGIQPAIAADKQAVVATTNAVLATQSAAAGVSNAATTTAGAPGPAAAAVSAKGDAK